MVETVRVRGAGGAEFVVDTPQPGSPLSEQISRGDLHVVEQPSARRVSAKATPPAADGG